MSNDSESLSLITREVQSTQQGQTGSVHWDQLLWVMAKCDRTKCKLVQENVVKLEVLPEVDRRQTTMGVRLESASSLMNGSSRGIFSFSVESPKFSESEQTLAHKAQWIPLGHPGIDVATCICTLLLFFLQKGVQCVNVFLASAATLLGFYPTQSPNITARLYVAREEAF